jgi:hypothetical protein
MLLNEVLASLRNPVHVLHCQIGQSENIGIVVVDPSRVVKAIIQNCLFSLTVVLPHQPCDFGVPRICLIIRKLIHFLRLDHVILAHKPCDVPQLFQVVRQEPVFGGYEGIPIDHGLPFLTFRALKELSISGPTRIVTCQDVVPAWRTHWRGNVLVHHDRPLARQPVDVRGQILSFALGQEVEHLWIHVICDEEDDVGAFCVCIRDDRVATSVQKQDGH